MDLGLLSLPLIAAAAIFGVATFTVQEPVYFEPVSVPAVLSYDGLSGPVIGNQLRDAVRRIQVEAQTADRTIDLEDSVAEKALENLSAEMRLTSWIMLARQMVGLIPVVMSGEVISQGRTLEFRLRTINRGQIETFVHQGDAKSLPDLIQAAAEDAMRVIDPYVLAHYYREKELNAGQLDFPRTMAAIEDCFRRLPRKDHNLAHYMWGRVAFFQGRLDEAVAHYREAVEIGPNFWKPYLRLAQIAADGGRIDDANLWFAAAAQVPHDHEWLQYEWARALVAAGRPDDAIAHFQAGIAASPDRAEGYEGLADLLLAKGRRTEAAQLYRQAAHLAPMNRGLAEKVARAAAGTPG